MEGMKSLQKRCKLKVRWKFYAAMHGKYVVDGIGDSVKKYDNGRIIAQNILVMSEKEFASIASSMATKVIPMEISDVTARNEKIINDSKPIVGITKNHCFEVADVGVKTVITEKVVGRKLSPMEVDDV